MVPTDERGNTWYRHADGRGLTFALRTVAAISHQDAERIATQLSYAIHGFPLLTEGATQSDTQGRKEMAH